MKQDKINGLVQAGIIGSALVLACISAKAVPFTEILNETAPVGTFTGPGPNVPPQSQGVIPDNSPIPGESPGGHPTLAFALSNNGGNQMVPGDVLIYEDAAHTILSDVLRFEDYGVGYVFVYSAQDDGPPALADTGMPMVNGVPAFQANNISFTEQFNGSAYGLFGYTPDATQPGYSTYVFNTPVGTITPGLNYTYDFTSEEVAGGVPDGGATAALLGMGLLAIAAFRKRLVR